MGNLSKYLGIVILLIGVVVLATHFFTHSGLNNVRLVIGLVLIVGGYLTHIFLNRRFQ